MLTTTTDVDVYVVGSSVTGLARSNSDTDMCVIFKDHDHREVEADGNKRWQHSMTLLEEVKRLLEQERKSRVVVMIRHQLC